MLPIRFLPHSVEILTPTTTGWINQVDGVNLQSGVSLFEETTGSQTDREFVAAKDITPTLPINTSDLTILSTVGFSGLLIASSSAHPGLVAFGRELPLGAVPTAIGTAHHTSFAVSDGLLVPVSLRAGHNTIAKLSLMLHAILGSSGTSGATPVVETSDVVIASGAGQAANFYASGPVKWTVSGGASQLLQGISDSSVDFGIKVFTEGSDSEVYPTHVSIIQRMPKITFTTKDVEQIAAIGDGVAVSAFACYFRNIAANGQRVAAATTSHVSVSGTAGMITPSGVSLPMQSAGTTAFVYTPVLNTTILSISIAAAIPVS